MKKSFDKNSAKKRTAGKSREDDVMVGKGKKRGLVYVLTNPAFPEVKIGLVNFDEVQKLRRRIKQHSDGSVPTNFKLHYAIEVDDVNKAEKLLHDVFAEVRVVEESRKKQKEFFKISPDRVKSAMQLTFLSGKIRKNLKEYIEYGEIPAASQNRRYNQGDKPVTRERLPKSEGEKSSHIDMLEIGIPNGAKLTFNKDRSIKATVVGSRHISFQDQKMTLTAAAREAFKKLGIPKGALSGPNHWEYKGETLKKIRARWEESAPKKQLPKSEMRRSPSIDMFKIGIPNGAELTFNKDRSFKATVVGPQKISFQGKEVALTPAARDVFRKLGILKKELSGPSHWEYKGETLKKIRARWDENKKG